MLQITNTLTNQKELFSPINPPQVTMYVCGITPYDYAHIGHGRCYVVFDCLYRLLRFLGYSVTYCRNITDIDDKLLRKADELFGDQSRYAEIVQTVMTDFSRAMHDLNCVVPTYEPRVTDSIDTIIAFIQGLIDQSYAYQSNGSVYFSVTHFLDYGILSKQKIDELRSGSRVAIDEEKKDPLDFALWKAEKDGTFWKSPWGYGRPGWHIECSAMTASYLGESIDIHGGGLDLIFPHHENEIAQSQALHSAPFARIWVHSGLIFSQKQKMSKSLGNAYTLHELLKEVDPMVLRFYYFGAHYRTPLDFSLQGLEIAHKNYQRLCTLFAPMQAVAFKRDAITPEDYPLVYAMIRCLEDDVNVTGVIGLLFEQIQVLPTDAVQGPMIKYIVQEILGLRLEPLPEKNSPTITAEIQALLDAREAARNAKDFKRADAIRAQLQELGFTIQDKKI